MKKYLHPLTYINLIKQQWKCFLLKQQSHNANWAGSLNNVWNIKAIENSDIQLDSSGYFIFGATVLFDNVNWHAEQFEEYNYSPGYDQMGRANRIVVRNKNKVSITFNFSE